MPRTVHFPALFSLLLLLAVACAPGFCAALPTARDKDNYERLLAIVLTGSKENKDSAKASLRGMGEAGIELLKADCADVDSPRGALAWSLLKELWGDSQKETLLDFARGNLVEVARSWNQTYVKGKADKAKQARLRDITSDYVNLLAASDKPKDFELLLKALKSSLVVSDAKADFGGEFEIWTRVWTLLNAKVKACESARDLEGWRSAIDGHFRNYSLMKGYVDRKAIQAYHTTTLLLMQRLDDVRKRPAAKGEETAP